jgi:hypothetical protein
MVILSSLSLSFYYTTLGLPQGLSDSMKRRGCKHCRAAIAGPSQVNRFIEIAIEIGIGIEVPYLFDPDFDGDFDFDLDHNNINRFTRAARSASYGHLTSLRVAPYKGWFYAPCSVRIAGCGRLDFKRSVF